MIVATRAALESNHRSSYRRVISSQLILPPAASVGAIVAKSRAFTPIEH